MVMAWPWAADTEPMAKQQQDLAFMVERLARALAARDTAAEHYARGALASSEWNSRHARVRPELQAGIFIRDSFLCSYCRARTVPLPILELTGLRLTRSELMPETFLLITTSCSHIKPVTRGGSSARDNLATACWRCDATKADSVLEDLRWPKPRLGPHKDEEWRGLTEIYRPLWEAAGRPEPRRHERWLQALEPARVSTTSQAPPPSR
jgi:5-methylcytosine-specific restriction endonuclease McrA